MSTACARHEIAKRVSRVDVLAERDRDRRLPPQLAMRRGRRPGAAAPRASEARTPRAGAPQLLACTQVPFLVGVDHQHHVGADRLAHRAHAPHVLREVRQPHLHLERGVAAVQQPQRFVLELRNREIEPARVRVVDRHVACARRRRALSRAAGRRPVRRGPRARCRPPTAPSSSRPRGRSSDSCRSRDPTRSAARRAGRDRSGRRRTAYRAPPGSREPPWPTVIV